MPTIEERVAAVEATIKAYEPRIESLEAGGGIVAWLKANPLISLALSNILTAAGIWATTYLSTRGPTLPAAPVDPPAVKKFVAPVEVKPTMAVPSDTEDDKYWKWSADHRKLIDDTLKATDKEFKSIRETPRRSYEISQAMLKDRVRSQSQIVATRDREPTFLDYLKPEETASLFPPMYGNWLVGFVPPSPVVDEPEVVAPTPRIEAKKAPAPFRFKD